MKIAAWNINSIKMRLTHLRDFIAEHNPDVILLQEIKCETEKFPLEELSDLPYNFYIHGQKTYNGVGILSKYRADEIYYDFNGNPCEGAARFLEIVCNTPLGFYRFISLYAPNGGTVGSDKFQQKLVFYDALTSYLENRQTFDEKLIIGGDFNIAPFDIDVYSPSHSDGHTCFTIEERFKMRELLNMGFFDIFRLVHPGKQEFSWWDYRAGAFEQNRGLRIDMILGNATATCDFKESFIDYGARAKEKASDHAPVIIIG